MFFFLGLTEHVLPLFYLQPFAEAPTKEAVHAFLNLDLALECDGKKFLLYLQFLICTDSGMHVEST
jgi:hypothetical protein